MFFTQIFLNLGYSEKEYLCQILKVTSDVAEPSIAKESFRRSSIFYSNNSQLEHLSSCSLQELHLNSNTAQSSEIPSKLLTFTINLTGESGRFKTLNKVCLNFTYFR